MQYKFYACFSINLHRFIKAHGIKYMSKKVHQNGKTFWVYKIDSELEEVLETWSRNKPNK